MEKQQTSLDLIKNTDKAAKTRTHTQIKAEGKNK